MRLAVPDGPVDLFLGLGGVEGRPFCAAIDDLTATDQPAGPSHVLGDPPRGDPMLFTALGAETDALPDGGRY
jgi:hypothetical protein